MPLMCPSWALCSPASSLASTSTFALIGFQREDLTSQGEAPFQAEEVVALQTAFELDEEQIAGLIETASFILETVCCVVLLMRADADMQAAYHQLSPKNLNKHLSALGLEEAQVCTVHVSSRTLCCVKVAAFIAAWSSSGADLIVQLRDRSFYPRSVCRRSIFAC